MDGLVVIWGVVSLLFFIALLVLWLDNFPPNSFETRLSAYASKSAVAVLGTLVWQRLLSRYEPPCIAVSVPRSERRGKFSMPVARRACLQAPS